MQPMTTIIFNTAHFDRALLNIIPISFLLSLFEVYLHFVGQLEGHTQVLEYTYMTRSMSLADIETTEIDNFVWGLKVASNVY